MNENTGDPIIFGNLPNPDELCHIYISIDSNEKKDKSVKSEFQWQILKTRILIFSDVNLIACPSGISLRTIDVIVSKEYYITQKLMILLEKLRLKIERVDNVEMHMYEYCMNYYFIARLSPHWNSVKNYLVEGKHFLMQRGCCNSIEVKIGVICSQLVLALKPLRLRLHTVSILDFEPPISVLENIISKPFFLDLTSSSYWVHVLPSMKKGRILYVTNRLPESCVFSDYLEIRRHWKNMYGYRLPENGESMIYVGVNFFGTMNFTYPLPCVRWGLHLSPGSPDVRSRFVKGVESSISSVCGSKLEIESDLLYPTFDLNPLNKLQEGTKSNLINLTLKAPDDIKSSNVSMYSQNLTPQRNSGFLENSMFSLYGTQEINMTAKQAMLKIRSPTALPPYPPTVMLHKEAIIKNEHSSAFRPVFTKHSSKMSVTESVQEINDTDFLAKKHVKVSSFEANPTPEEVYSQNVEPRKPIFFPQKKTFRLQNNKNDTTEQTVSEQQNSNCIFRPIFIPKSQVLTAVDRMISKKSSFNSAYSESLIRSFPETRAPPNVLQVKSTVPLKRFFKKAANVGAFSNLFQTLPKKNSENEDRIKKPVSKETVPVNKDRKRVLKKEVEVMEKKKHESGEQLSMKKRNKPTLLSREEVEQHALKGDLGKVNAASLIEYLKSNGVSCRSHEKKQQLIDKTLMTANNRNSTGQ